MEHEPLLLPMMMFGKFRSERVVKDKEGNTLHSGFDKKGKPKPVKKKVWNEHVEGVDQGMYPSVNHIYVNMAKGRKRLSEPAERLKAGWESAALMWAKDNDWKMTVDEKIVVELTAFFPDDKTKRDTNNVFKLMLDAFEGILYNNDYYVLPRVMDFKKVKENEKPYFLVTIYKKEEELHVSRKRVESGSLALSANG